MRSSGFEPPRSCERQPLKLVRLPVPPRPLYDYDDEALEKIVTEALTFAEPAAVAGSEPAKEQALAATAAPEPESAAP